MKDKRTTLLLIVAVGLVWGFALYQFIVGFLGKDDAVYNKPVLSESLPINLQEEEFELQVNYRDPFLGKVFIERTAASGVVSTHSQASAKKVAKPEPEVKKMVDLSFVHYIGLIKNQKSGKQVSLLAINGKDYFMVEGQTEKEVTLVKNLVDSVQINYQGSNYYIKK